MRNNTIIFFDFEATSANPNKAQPAQLAAVAINPYKLEIPHDGVFNSFIKPEFDEKICEQLDLDPPTDRFYEITKIKPRQLERAADLGTVWGEFQDFVGKFNPKKDRWSSPIRSGYNIIGYDNIIIDRICGGHKIKDSVEEKLWGYGPWDKTRQTCSLFHPIFQIDTMQLMWYWFEGDEEIRSVSMDSIRSITGMDTDHAHNALYDVVQGAYLVIKLMRHARRVYHQTKFHDSFNTENPIIDSIVQANWKE